MVMRSLVTILFLLLGGCYSNTLPVRICDASAESCQDITPETKQLLDDVSDILELDIDPRSTSRGVVLSILVETSDPFIGRSIPIKGYPCLRVVHSERDPGVYAHELGHALGLEHPCELRYRVEGMCPRYSGKEVCTSAYEGRLMHPAVVGDHLTPGEREEMHKGLRKLERCRGE